MPLIMVGIGETCTIQRIGGSEETRRFLANLGFVQGAEVTVLSAIGGNVQLQTDAICDKIDIHIKVLTIEVYGNKSA